MNVAQRSIELNNFGRAQNLLDRHRPKAGEEDSRGWEWRFLWQQYRSDAEFALGQTNDWVNTLGVSADGQFVAMGERDGGNMKVWNLRTRQPLATISCGDYILKAAFAPAGSLIAVGAMVKTSGRNANVVRIISIGEAKPRQEITLDGFCAGLGFSPDGTVLAVNSGETVTRWQVADGKLLSTPPLPGPGRGNRQGGVFSKDLSLLATDAGRGEIAVVDLATGRELWSKPCTDKYFTSAAFSPDGRFLVTAAGYAETLARVWDARTGSEVKVLAGHGAYVLDLAFSPDGQTLATTSADQTVRLWSTADWRAQATLRGHRLEVWRVAWLPDNQRLVSGAKDGSVLVWNRLNLRRQPMFLTLPAGIIDWAFPSDSKTILTLNQAGQVTQWGGADFSEGNPLFEVGTNVTSARFSPDATILAVCVTNRLIQFWNVPRRVMLHEFPGFPGEGSIYKFAGERQLAAVERGDWRMRIFEVPSGQEMESIPLSEQDGVVAFQNDRAQMVRIPYRGPSQARGITNSQFAEINLAVRQPGNGSFSPDGKFLAVANKFGFARVWETATWKETGTFGNFLKGVHSVAWGPDSKRLAVTSGEKEAVKLWDVLNGEELITLEGKGGMLSSSMFSPDGNVLTALDENGALNIWRAPSWEQIRADEQ
jgi:WD40 repeat protein